MDADRPTRHLRSRHRRQSPDDRPSVRLGAGPEVAAALPHLLGFGPQESLVVVALTGDRGRRVGLTLRVDLPPPGLEADLAAGVLDALRPGRPTAAVLLVVTEEPDERGSGALDAPVDRAGDVDRGLLRLLEEPPGRVLPRLSLLREVTSALAAERIGVHESLLVRSGRCWSYDEGGPAGGPGAGRPLPGGTSPLAAAAAFAGQVVETDRAALVQRLARVSEPAASAMARACAQVGAGHAALLAAEGRERCAEESWRALLTALERCRPGHRGRLDDELVARVAWAVTDIEVRDRVLGLGLGEHASSVEALWTAVVRRVPAPLGAAPATLLAVTAWCRGDGTTASVALDRALEEQPEYALALLLRSALAAALPPGELRRLVIGIADGPTEGPSDGDPRSPATRPVARWRRAG